MLRLLKKSSYAHGAKRTVSPESSPATAAPINRRKRRLETRVAPPEMKPLRVTRLNLFITIRPCITWNRSDITRKQTAQYGRRPTIFCTWHPEA